MLFDNFYTPGMGDPVVSTESEFWTGRMEGYQIRGGTIVSTAVDSGNTPTSTIRRGLVMGTITASGKFKQYAATATDGSQIVTGILLWGRNMLDIRTGTAIDRPSELLIGGVVLKTSQLIGFDENARRQLSNRFMFDDNRYTFPGPRTIEEKTTNYTVVAADAGKTFSTRGAAGAVTFTLPALANVAPGWTATFYNEVGQNMTVTGPAGTVVTFNNAAATSVSFQTAGNLIGGSFIVTVNGNASKYLVQPTGANTVTVA